MTAETTFWVTLICFALTYLGLAVGKVPGLRMDRASIAFVGAVVMLITGVLSLPEAVATDSIDYKTLALLFGMMVVVGFLRLSLVFQTLSASLLKRVRSPWGLLAVTVVLSGVLSAFLINDIVCLALTPLVLHLARKLRCDPLPHLIALATAANVGSAGTITGNPQNIYIGSHSGIPYLVFALRLLPVAAVGLVVNFALVALVYRKSLSRPPEAEPSEPTAESETNGKEHRAVLRSLRIKSIAVALATVLLFFTGLPLELIALGAAALLLASRIKPTRVYAQIDWDLLVLFTSLFIVVHAFQVHIVRPHWHVESWHWLLDHPIGLMSVVSVVLSNLVSNVPAVLLMEPILQAVSPPYQQMAWLALAASSTFAGNLTVLGSVANLIVIESARRSGVNVSFWEYSKVGVPLTVVTVALSILWLGFLAG
jgi:Na+/H+ antiporter NhaD/arsenite permease-like protein